MTHGRRNGLVRLLVAVPVVGILCCRLLHAAGIPRRKESFEQIRKLAMNILAEMPVRTTLRADAAWRRAVETWLQRAGIIAVSEPKSGTRFP